MLDDAVAHVVADRALIPDRLAEQVLHAIWSGIPGVRHDRSAVLAWQLRQQAAHERGCPPSRLDTSEPAGAAAHQFLEGCLPAGGVYASACGHRVAVPSRITRRTWSTETGTHGNSTSHQVAPAAA
jgi:hypothetical protein